MAFKHSIIQWRDAGFRPFPCVVFYDKDQKKREKEPLVEWKRYQNDAPVNWELEDWGRKISWGEWAGIEIATGRGFAVVDLDSLVPLVVDGKISIERLSQFEWIDPENFPYCVATSSGGLHLYFRTLSTVTNAQNVFGQLKKGDNIIVDIRGDGGFVVTCPTTVWQTDPREGSLIVARGEYRALTQGFPKLEDLPPLPGELLGKTGAKIEPAYKRIPVVGVLTEGSRHASAISLALSIANGVHRSTGFEQAFFVFKQTLRASFDIKGFDPDGDEVKFIWRDVTNKIKEERGLAWTVIEPAKERGKIDAEQFAWGFQIISTQKVGEMLDFEVAFVDGEVRRVGIMAADVLTQMKFRQAFFVSSGKMLVKISNKAFEDFLSKLKIEEIVGVGTDLKEVILDVLRSKFVSIRETSSDEESVENVRIRLWNKKKNVLQFKLSALMGEHSLHNFSSSRVVSMLRVLLIPCTPHPTAGNIWEWTKDF